MSQKKHPKVEKEQTEFFRKNENIQELLDELRDAFIDYKESANKCKIEFKPRHKLKPSEIGKSAKKGDDFNYFYLPPRIPLLEEPEKQKVYIRDYIADVASRPNKEPISLLADSLHNEVLQKIPDQSKPSQCRQLLCKFYKRYSVHLQHKKYKLLSRWNDQVLSAQLVDTVGAHFDRHIGRLIQEHNSAVQKSERLEIDDSYEAAVDPQKMRPQPVSNQEEGGQEGTLLYVESAEKSVNSVIKQEDIEVYLRIQTYRRRIMRSAEKLACSIKWIPYQSRFPVFQVSRELMFAYKVEYKAMRERVYQPVLEFVKARIIENGLTDEKQIYLLSDKFTDHLKTGYTTNYEETLNSYKSIHRKPPFLFTSNVELKSHLVPIAQEAGLRCLDTLDQDEGHQFSYQVSGMFPIQFEKQLLLMQFDWIDSGEGTQADTDVILIQKLTSELGLDKHETLAEMARHAEVERNKSILGKIGRGGKVNQTDENQIHKIDQAKKQKTDESETIAQNNLVRRIKELKFFSLDETSFSLKKADWLQYICWFPMISEFLVRQNNILSNQTENPIDSLLVSAFEFVDVNEAGAANKILEDSATSHVKKVRSYFKEISQQTSRFDNPQTSDQVVGKILRDAAIGQRIETEKQPSVISEDNPHQYNQPLVEEYLQMIDPLKQHLIKSHYTLRYLKTRGLKVKMIQAVNFFRAVQKRLAFDVREFATRERALGGQIIDEFLIGPQFGTDEFGNLKAKKSGTQGPGGVNMNRLSRVQDSGQITNSEGQVTDHLNLKGFKYNKRFNPDLTSTCPCVPRFHSTFGRPFLYEEVSRELELREERQGRKLRSEGRPWIAYRDRLVFKRAPKNSLESEISVLDEHGIRVVYQESLNDMVQLEEEMIKIGSHFVNKIELELYQGSSDSPLSLIDRAQIAFDLYSQEFELQLVKLELVQLLLEAYEHTCDPLESLRLVQIITDIMAIRPRVDLGASYFVDSYLSEIDALKHRLQLYREVLNLQKEIEKKENDSIRVFQEIKFRKLIEFIDGKWVFKPDNNKIVKPSSNDETVGKHTELNKKKIDLEATFKEQQRELALKEIAQRHITEFAGNQHTDFADVLGLPEVTASDLFRRKAQQDPLVVDSIREMTTFSKQTEGYPWIFQKVGIDLCDLGLQTEGCGITDFYESFSAITRIHAACQQAQIELEHIHSPENGMASSALEQGLLQECRGTLRVLRSQSEEGNLGNGNMQRKIEEDFYLGSSDKLMYLVRDLKAQLNPKTIKKSANPLVVSKLDPKEVQKFDFPRLSPKDIPGHDDLKDEEVVAKMIEQASRSITQQISQQDEEVDRRRRRDSEDEEEEKKEIKSPSMMVLACNTVEMVRLRSLLVQLSHEVEELGKIYNQQLNLTNKQTWKQVMQEPLTLDPSSLLKDSMNMTDLNEGSKLKLDLAVVQEFDPTLKANLDFKSQSCIQSLMTNLGLEELRAVVFYQLMQKQLLVIGVMRNQALMDGPMQGLSELQLLQKRPHPLAVPGSIINTVECMSRAVDGPSADRCRKEATFFNSNLSKEVGDRMYSVTLRKSKHKVMIQKRFQTIMQRVNQSDFGVQTKLRILRSFRLKLLHDFCKDVLKDAYFDSLAIQTLHTCGQLRRKAILFPPTSKLFTLGNSLLQEQIPRDFLRPYGSVHQQQTSEDPGVVSLDQLLKGKPVNLLYIPSSNEIIDSLKTLENNHFKPICPTDKFELLDVDDQLVHSVSQPTLLPPNKTVQMLSHDRIPTYLESHDYSGTCFELLRFFSALLQIVTLEYLMGRNHSPANLILELEQSVRQGQSFWDAKLREIDDPRQLANLSERVVQKILNQKKSKSDLAEDLNQVAKRIRYVNQFTKSSNVDHLKLSFILDLMGLQQQASFFRFASGMEAALEIYLDHRCDINFSKLTQVNHQLARRDPGINLLGNGFYLNSAARNALDIDPGSQLYEDNDQFLAQYQPVIDEQALMPPQIQLVRRLYGRSSNHDLQASPGMVSLMLPLYYQLTNSFFNMDDDQRAFIATNFYNLDQDLDEYLILQGVMPNPRSLKTDSSQIHIVHPKDVLDATVEFFGQRVEAKHIQRVIISWITCKALPTQTQEFQDALVLYREQAMLKILLERDQMLEQYYESQQKSRDHHEAGGSMKSFNKRQAQERVSILESINPCSREHTVISRVFQTKAEIFVGRRILEVEMIKMSLNLIHQEDAGLRATFDQGGCEGVIQAFVHPQQQFASTLYQSVDQDSHLDVVNKLSFVQSYLTKLRNRCTEVSTLASGPGIVFSLKDFNDCLHILCQGLIKYGETELRSRVETQFIRQNQFQHLLYMKEKQALYYRRKCEQFLGDIDKLVNAKISQKGSQLIYELDIAQRELRTMKDNFKMMKSIMMEELRHEYLKVIQDQKNQIDHLKAENSQHRDHIVQTTVYEVSTKFKELETKVEKKKRDAAAINNEMGVFSPKTVSFQRNNLKPAVKIGETEFDDPRDKKTAEFNSDAVNEVIKLRAFIRKYKVLTMMKQVLTQERHEKDLANQRAQLTSNAALWDQLAEAEKREQITRQELNLTKFSLASYEKLIERLQGQLESLNNQKARLQQYKNTKSKRIDELENKMKDLEILENIDLNRIITELKSRDRKIEALQEENEAQKDHLEHVVQYKANKTLEELKKQVNQERELKVKAYERLEGLRLEMMAVDGKENKNEIWKDKCRELFQIVKDLERENDDLRTLVKDANRANLLKALDSQDEQNFDLSGQGSFAQPSNYLEQRTMGDLKQQRTQAQLIQSEDRTQIRYDMPTQVKQNIINPNFYIVNQIVNEREGIKTLSTGHEKLQQNRTLGALHRDADLSKRQHILGLRDNFATSIPRTADPHKSLGLSSNIYSSGHVVDVGSDVSIRVKKAIPLTNHYNSLHPQEGQDGMSVGSSGGFGDKSKFPNLIGGEAMTGVAGSIFAVPLQGNLGQRTILTAGGGQRGKIQEQVMKQVGGKRLQTSHGSAQMGRGGRQTQQVHSNKQDSQTGSTVPYSSLHFGSSATRGGFIQGKQVIPSEKPNNKPHVTRDPSQPIIASANLTK